ncbi:hypothetical protein ACFFRR_003254 [Megaselia abdita]
MKFLAVVPLLLAAVYAGDLGHGHADLALAHSGNLHAHGAISSHGVGHGAIAHDNLGGAGIIGGGHAGAALAGEQIVGVSQIRGPARVTQSLSRGQTVSSRTVGPTHVTSEKVAFTPGTTTIRRDYETDTVHNQHRVDHIRTDKVIPKVTTVQHNSVRPVDVTHARTHTEVSNSVKHIPHVSHSSHQQVHHSQNSVVHPQPLHAAGLGHGAGLGLNSGIGHGHGAALGSHAISSH